MRYANIRYSTLLNEAQYDYLSDECQDISRMKCFKTFIRLTLMEQTTVTKTHFSAVLQPGQFMASKVELSLMWGCNRKTATRIIREFNQMGILRSEPSNRSQALDDAIDAKKKKVAGLAAKADEKLQDFYTIKDRGNWQDPMFFAHCFL